MTSPREHHGPETMATQKVIDAAMASAAADGIIVPV
jgi:hypothetical protein